MKYISVTGDSIAHGVGLNTYDKRNVADLMAFQLPGFSVTNIAYPSDGTEQQQTRWALLSSELKQKFDYVVSFNGNNIISYAWTIESSVVRYQTLINDIKASVRPDCKIIVCTLTPTDKYTTTYPSYAAEVIANRAAFNEAIKGSGAFPLTGQDYIVTELTSYLDNGSGGMRSIYYENGADHLHPNRSGRDVMADAVIQKMKSLSLIK